MAPVQIGGVQCLAAFWLAADVAQLHGPVHSHNHRRCCRRLLQTHCRRRLRRRHRLQGLGRSNDERLRAERAKALEGLETKRQALQVGVGGEWAGYGHYC